MISFVLKKRLFLFHYYLDVLICCIAAHCPILNCKRNVISLSFAAFGNCLFSCVAFEKLCVSSRTLSAGVEVCAWFVVVA